MRFVFIDSYYSHVTVFTPPQVKHLSIWVIPFSFGTAVNPSKPSKRWLQGQGTYLCISCAFEGNYCFTVEIFKHLALEWLGLYVCFCKRVTKTLSKHLNHVLYFVADVDECQQVADVCLPQRTCRNTFGSFICVCQDGFVMGTLQGSVQCRGERKKLL